MQRFLDFLHKSPVLLFAVCLAIAALYVCVISSIVPIRFEDNDDVTYAWIASGVYTGTPDIHLVFLNALYGCLVAGLYNLFPRVEWYSVLFLFWLALSAAVCLYYVLKDETAKTYKLLGISIIILFLTYFVIRLQFTTVAASLAFAGLLLLCKRNFIFGGVLLLLGSLIRFEAAGMVGVIMMPVIAMEYKFDWKKAWASLGIVLILVFFTHRADILFYNSTEWQRFITCCNLTSRGKINDNPNIWRLAQNLPENISPVDFNLITAFAPDPETATPELLAAIDKELRHIPLIKKIKNIYTIFIPRYKWWLALLLLAFLPLLIFTTTKSRIYSFIVIALWFILLCVLQMNASVKLRVFLSSLLPIIYVWYKQINGIKINSLKYASSSVFVAGLCFFMLQPLVRHLKQIPNQDRVWIEQKNLLNMSEGYKVITDGADLHVEYIDVFDLRNAITPNTFINPYCFSGCPLTPEYMSYRDFLKDKLLIFTSKPVNMDMRLRSIKEHYCIDAEAVVVAQSDNFALVKIIKEE